LPREAQPLVYLERTIYGGVVDEAFPANGRAWFLDGEKNGQGGTRVGVSGECVVYLTAKYAMWTPVNKAHKANQSGRTNKLA